LTVAVLGLGGNIGDPRALMSAASARLARHPGIALEAVSALYKTPPWGKTDQPAFLNAALLIDTTLDPQALLAAVLDVEREFGRHRNDRWGPRTIDIDILLFGALEIDEPGLHIPHSHLSERAFALAPLVDVMPDAEFGGRRAADWLARADRSGMRRIAEPGWENRA
jgi:2-amino-4-hydroxy-6-hydroxymethyldihydropteridine diphosphokinase